jgi:hypothetical protein
MSPAASPAASPAPSPSPTATPIPHAFSISGYGDIGYSEASHASAVNSGLGPVYAPNAGLITGRVFDQENNQVQFHNFNIQAAYTPLNGLGGKVEYSFGDDASVIHSYPQSLSNTVSYSPGGTTPNSNANLIDLTQAYLSYLMGPVTIQVGKFETLAGAEVIESPSDLNFSRSILFGYAVPFTHTGGRITFAATPDLNIIIGANQGWDTTSIVKNTTDVNGLTAEYGLAWTPSKIFSLTAQGYNGQVEQGSANAYAAAGLPGPQPIRQLTDFVATYHYNPAFTITLNGDFGSQNRSFVYGRDGSQLVDAFGNPIIGTDNWDGAALYLSYTKGLFTLTGRGEYFADTGGIRTGFAQDWEEGTVTLAYAPNNNLIFRVEYRYDASNAQYQSLYGPATGFFASSSGIPVPNNGGLGVEGIVKWP